MSTLILLAAFAFYSFFSFTDKGRKIYATNWCSFAILSLSAYLVISASLSIFTYINPLALLSVAVWGYIGYGAFMRVKPLLKIKG